MFVNIKKKMNEILDVMEYIKQNITDNQYKTIMDALKEIYNIKDYESLSFKYVSLINWLDTKLDFNTNEQIKMKELHQYIIINFYKDRYFSNIDFVKKALELYFFDKKRSIYKCYYHGVKFKKNVS